MGAVWRAHHEQLEIDVAIKQLVISGAVEEGERQQRVERALREGRTVARLEPHPHVVRVRDLIEEDGLPWLVMDLVPGQSLTELVQRQGPLSVPRTVAIAGQLLDALRAIHQQDVLHRDIKPDNVLVKKGDHAVLVDFGIAHNAKDPHLTDTGLVIGTPEYLDPERLTDKPVGPGSDLFSLGATLYFAVEGRSPFSGKNDALLHAILYERPLPIRRAGPLTRLLTDLLQPAMSRRPSVEEALHRTHELLETASSATVQAPDSGAGGRRRKNAPPPPTEADGRGAGGNRGAKASARQPPNQSARVTSGGVGEEGPEQSQPRRLVFGKSVPRHLRPALVEWLRESTYGALSNRVAAKVRFTAYTGSYVDFDRMSDKQLWEAADYVLRVGPNASYSRNHRSELRNLLEAADAPYRVAEGGGRLKLAGAPRNAAGARPPRRAASTQGHAGSAGVSSDHGSGDGERVDTGAAGPPSLLSTAAPLALASAVGLAAVGAVLVPVFLPLLLGAGHANPDFRNSPGVHVWPLLGAIALDLGCLAAWVYAFDDFFLAEEPFKAAFTVFLVLTAGAYYCGTVFHGHLSFIDQWGKMITGWLLRPA